MKNDNGTCSIIFLHQKDLYPTITSKIVNYISLFGDVFFPL